MDLIRKHIRIILPAMLIFLLAGLVLSRVVRPGGESTPDITVDASDAINHVGSNAEVCGYAAGTSYRPDISGSPTFINFEMPYPDHVFTAIIWGNNRSRWASPPEELYNGRNICVSGRIRLHEEKPQIVLTSPGQVTMR
jgi:hypothetical protein